jgi:hypothetical protein
MLSRFSKRGEILTTDGHGVKPRGGHAAIRGSRNAGWIFKRQKTAEKACAPAEKSGEQNLLQKNQELLELYRAHQPYHEPLEKLAIEHRRKT